jgi:hypothetical protein
MSNQSAGTLLQQAIKTLCTTAVKILFLVFAWCCELAGKVLFKISEVVKSNTKL